MTYAEFLFLGTGGSAGIPMIGCKCSVCTSSNPHNKRCRPSGLITCEKKRILIDAGPDFRAQALRCNLDSLDGVLLTHSHFDHVAGLDELRVYYLLTKKHLPILLARPTFLDLKRRYDYFFQERSWGVSLPAQLDFHPFDGEYGSIHFLDLEIIYTLYDQGGMPVTGFRFGSLAYISDIRKYPSTIFTDLQGIKILILGMLRHESSPMHFNLDEAVAFARQIGAEKTYFTHMSHELDHDATNALLPQDMQLTYDGLKLDFEF